MPKESNPFKHESLELPQFKEGESGVRRRPVERDPIIEEKKKKEKTKTDSVLSALRKKINSPLFRAGALALTLHAPLSPQVQNAYEQVKDFVLQSEEEDESRDDDRILRPQSFEDMLKVTNETAERKSRVNKKALQSFKEDVRDKLDKGEAISFVDLYLEMEKQNGVDSELVEEAKRIANEKIESTFLKSKGKLDREFLVDFVQEMYGSADNYVWGQGTVTKYFKTQKRNCVAIAKAQMIVLEGIINKLSVEERQNYELGINKIDQHEVATLTVKNKSGGSETFLLEGEVKTLRDQIENAGSKTVTLDQIKKSMVAEKPVVLKAKKGRKGEVKSGPEISVLTDQPVDDGIRIEGKLRGSDYALEQAEKQGKKPEVRQTVKQESSWEISETQLEEKKVEEKKGEIKTEKSTPEEIAKNWRTNQYYVENFLDISSDDLDAFADFLKVSLEIQVHTYKNGKLNPKFFHHLEAFRKTGEPITTKILRIKGTDTEKGEFMPTEQFKDVVECTGEIPILVLNGITYLPKDAEEILSEAKQQIIYLDQAVLSSRVIEGLKHGETTVMINLGYYTKLILEDPSLINHPKLVPILSNVSTTELEDFASAINSIVSIKDPRYKFLEDEIMRRRKAESIIGGKGRVTVALDDMKDMEAQRRAEMKGESGPMADPSKKQPKTAQK